MNRLTCRADAAADEFDTPPAARYQSHPLDRKAMESSVAEIRSTLQDLAQRLETLGRYL
jgi:hypothetical protein